MAAGVGYFCFFYPYSLFSLFFFLSFPPCFISFFSPPPLFLSPFSFSFFGGGGMPPGEAAEGRRRLRSMGAFTFIKRVLPETIDI